jgi:hypothetical protein
MTPEALRRRRFFRDNFTPAASMVRACGEGVAGRKMREAIIGASVYLWSVNEKNHFLQTNLHKTPSEKKCSQLFVCK